jgi:hypothetical protein
VAMKFQTLEKLTNQNKKVEWGERTLTNRANTILLGLNHWYSSILSKYVFVVVKQVDLTITGYIYIIRRRILDGEITAIMLH